MIKITVRFQKQKDDWDGCTCLQNISEYKRLSVESATDSSDFSGSEDVSAEESDDNHYDWNCCIIF
eukprot:Pgem_evm1s18525